MKFLSILLHKQKGNSLSSRVTTIIKCSLFIRNVWNEKEIELVKSMNPLRTRQKCLNKTSTLKIHYYN